MAMATPLYYASPIPTKTKSHEHLNSPPSVSSRTCITRQSTPVSTPSLSLRSTPRPPLSMLVAEATTSAVEFEPQISTVTPSKALPGYPLIIGGINIPHDRGCEAHSDGDVLLHCVVDAILGALGLPDIGQIFPDYDPKWKGAASSVFIKEAVRLMHEAGYELGNLDATLILQRP